MSHGKNKNQGNSTAWRVSPCIWLLPPLATSILILCRCIGGVHSTESAELYRQSGEVMGCLLFLLIYSSLVELRLFLPQQADEAKRYTDARRILHATHKRYLMATVAATLMVFPRLAGTLGVSAYPDWISKVLLAVCAAVTVLGGMPMIRLFLLAREDAPMQDAEQSERGE